MNRDIVAFVEQLHHRLSRLEAWSDFDEHIDLSDGPVLHPAQESQKTDALHRFVQEKLRKVETLLSSRGYSDHVLFWTDDLKTRDGQVRRGIACVSSYSRNHRGIQMYVDFNPTMGAFAHIECYSVNFTSKGHKRYTYIHNKTDVNSASDLVAKLIHHST